ncbi:MAG TPA: hypothetical protein VMX58_01345 [Patescibacteria group bacterium]|nr:hypothetical protein [Patescibacteria group bacterium]
MRCRPYAILIAVSLSLTCAAYPAGASPGGLAGLIIDYPSISPNGDGIKDSSPVRITIDEPCDTISVTIEEVGQVLDTLLFELDAPPGTYTASWEGLDSLGALLPEGAYTLHLIVVSAGTVEQDTRTVIVDITPPVVQLDRIDPGIFTPGIGGAAETVLIYFLINNYEEGSILTITVFDPEQIPEELPPPDGITGDGLYHVEWPVESTPADGIHAVSLHLEDMAGNSSADDGIFDVDIDGPAQDLLTQVPDITREVPPVLEGYCYDRNGVETPAFVWNDGDPVPPHGIVMQGDTLIWQFDIGDSVTIGGEYIEGDYSLDVTCADLFGHETILSFTFEIDRTPPASPAIRTPYTPVSDPDLVLEVVYDALETDSFIVYRGHGGTIETMRMGAVLYVNITLEEGENTIWIEGLDEAGNTSASSNTVTVVYETALGFFYPEVFRGPDIFRVLTGADANKARVDIYTVSGEQVVTFKQSGPAHSFQFEWDLTNGDGEGVRNGTYIVVITIFYPDSKRIEKNFIAVVR